jgi:hypothetical protein
VLNRLDSFDVPRILAAPVREHFHKRVGSLGDIGSHAIEEREVTLISAQEAESRHKRVRSRFGSHFCILSIHLPISVTQAV